MGFKEIFTESTIARYAREMRAAPKEIILNRNLLFSAALYALSGIPISEKFPARSSHWMP